MYTGSKSANGLADCNNMYDSVHVQEKERGWQLKDELIKDTSFVMINLLTKEDLWLTELLFSSWINLTSNVGFKEISKFKKDILVII